MTTWDGVRTDSVTAEQLAVGDVLYAREIPGVTSARTCLILAVSHAPGSVVLDVLDGRLGDLDSECVERHFTFEPARRVARVRLEDQR